MIINSCVALMANCAKNAVPYKKRFGENAYKIGTLKELISGKPMDIEIDIGNGEHKIGPIKSMFMSCFNGKYGGSSYLLNPIGLINDGLMEFMCIEGQMGFIQSKDLFDQALGGGVHIYDPRCKQYRCRDATLKNLKADV